MVAEQHRLEFILRAREPIAHAQGTIGNTQVIMRRKVMMPNGTDAMVPFITGDTMRHGLREAGSYALLQAAGLLDDPQLSEGALRLLFAGGMVMGTAADVVRIEDERKWRELVPHLALLGGCIGNRIVPGKIEVGDAWLICEETVAGGQLSKSVLEWLREEERMERPARAHVEMVQRVRMDPTLVPAKRLLLASGDANRVEQRLLASEVASAREDHAGKDREKSAMMPFSYETVVAGSLFAWRIDCVTHNDIERDALAMMVSTFANRMRVGGKKGTGNGLLDVVHAFGSHRPRAREDLLTDEEVGGGGVVERFVARAQAQAAELRKWLGEVKA